MIVSRLAVSPKPMDLALVTSEWLLCYVLSVLRKLSAKMIKEIMKTIKKEVSLDESLNDDNAQKLPTKLRRK